MPFGLLPTASQSFWFGSGYYLGIEDDYDPGLVLVHTGVPESMEGRGIGGQLVAAAVQRAVASGETLVPQCPYARSWLEKHPDEAARVTVDWGGSAG